MLWNKRQVIYKQLDYKDLKMEGFNSMTSQILVGDSNHRATKRYLVSWAIIITRFTCENSSCNNIARQVEFKQGLQHVVNVICHICFCTVWMQENDAPITF